LLLLVFTFINPVYADGSEKEKEKTPFDKYPFIIPATIIVIIFVIGSWLFIKFHIKGKFTIILVTSIILSILSIFSGTSGFWLLFFKEIKINFLGYDLTSSSPLKGEGSPQLIRNYISHLRGSREAQRTPPI